MNLEDIIKNLKQVEKKLMVNSPQQIAVSKAISILEDLLTKNKNLL